MSNTTFSALAACAFAASFAVMRRSIRRRTRCSSCGSTRCIPASATFSSTRSTRFVEGQEARACAGRAISRLGDPDRFVWLRGFTDMEARKEALTDMFYAGRYGKRTPRRGTGTMGTRTTCLLLRPLRPDTAFRRRRRSATASRHARPRQRSARREPRVCRAQHPERVRRILREGAETALGASGRPVIAQMVSEHGPNTYPICRCGRSRTCSSGSRCLRTRHHWISSSAHSRNRCSGARGRREAERMDASSDRDVASRADGAIAATRASSLSTGPADTPAAWRRRSACARRSGTRCWTTSRPGPLPAARSPNAFTTSAFGDRATLSGTMRMPLRVVIAPDDPRT